MHILLIGGYLIAEQWVLRVNRLMTHQVQLLSSFDKPVLQGPSVCTDVVQWELPWHVITGQVWCVVLGEAVLSTPAKQDLCSPPAELLCIGGAVPHLTCLGNGAMLACLLSAECA